MLFGVNAYTLNAQSVITKESKKENSDVFIQIAIPTFVKSGEGCVVKIKMINKSEKNISYPIINGIYECQLSIVDAKNDPVELTPLGNRFIHIIPFHRRHGIIAPGGTFTWEIELNKYFNLSHGKYTLNSGLLFDCYPKESIAFEIK
jgi:hypothetical protein